MGFYDNHIAPKLVDWGCATKPIMKQRAKIVPFAQGDILEIGIGSGHNFDFYDYGKVKNLIGLEPSQAMRKMAQKRADERGLDLRFMDLSAEKIPMADKKMDCVLVTYSLCTIGDPQAALAEMKRVLKKKGCLLFCEHGIAKAPNIRKWQYRIEPIWKKIAGGCHLTRDIIGLIKGAGFELDWVDDMRLPNTPAIAAYNYWGMGRKPD